MVVLADGEQEFEALVGRQRGTPAALPLPDGAGLREIGRRAAREAERIALADALERVRGNRLAASRILGISYETILTKITEYGLIHKNGRVVAAAAAAVVPASTRGAGAGLDAK